MAAVNRVVLASLTLIALGLAGCGSSAGDVRGQARTAFESAVANDAKNLDSISLPANASAGETQQIFSAFASEILRFKSDVQSIKYPDDAKADADKLAADLTSVASIGQRISASTGQVATGQRPSDIVSSTEFCNAVSQLGTDTNTLFGDLKSSERYRPSAIACG